MKKNNYIALGGLFIALHLLFIFISRLLVGSELILVIFLPLLSTLYALKFNYKEVAMFVIASFLLCVIFEPICTFIYVLPALICGTLYGILRKKKVKELSLLYLTSLSHALSLLISFVSISVMFKEVSFFEIFASFLHKEGLSLYVSIYLILIGLGVLESFLVHVISNGELKRLGYKEIETENETPLWINICLVVSLVSYLILALINPLISCYAFPFVLAFCIPNIIESILKNKRKWIYLFLIGLGLLIIYLLQIINPIFYPILVILFFAPLIIENFVRVLYIILLKYSNNGKNNIE